jgi:hypothetical protein
VAAAASNDAFDAALQNVNKRLSALRKQCRLPSQLDADIEQFWKALGATERSVQRLQNMCTPQLRRAIGERFRKVKYAADAFREHTRQRQLREDAPYLRSRADLAEWLVDEIDELMGFCSTLK